MPLSSPPAAHHTCAQGLPGVHVHTPGMPTPVAAADPPLFIFASSICKSLQCLISALTQEGEGGHLFRLTCSVLLCGGRNTENKSLACVGSARSVSAALGLPPLTACVFSLSTLLRLQVALQGNCLKWALGCMHVPGLSHSGSGSWVLHKVTDLVGPAFCALPRSE